MIVPILIGAGLLVAAVRAVERKHAPGVTVAGTRARPPTALELVKAHLRAHRAMPAWLIDAAMADAYDAGDWRTLATLHRAFGQPDEPEPEREVEEPEAKPDEDLTIDEAEKMMEPPETVIGKVSPIEGVPNEAWTRFVGSLETEAPDYAGPKHVGRYHHSRERLAQLGINEVATPEAQYDALVKDLTDAHERAGELIRDVQFVPLTVNGQETIPTLSGILAVLKSAGIDRARSWFTNPEDRSKFPKTSEMYSRANGAF